MKQAGRRDRLLTHYRQSSVVDAYGSTSSNDWVKVQQFWGEIVPRGAVGSSETLVAFQLYPQSKIVLIIDHPSPADLDGENMVRHSDRIQHEGQEYFIEGIEEIGRRDGLRLYCIMRGDGVAS